MELVSSFSALALGLMVVTAPTVSAQDVTQDAAPNTTVANFDKWTVRCATPETGKVCAINQIAVAGEQRQRIMRVSVIKSPSANGEIMRIVLPLGTDLARGAQLVVSDATTMNNLPFGFCLQDGCYTEVQLTSALLSQMRAGGEGSVTIYPLNSANPLTIPISFGGFSDAYANFLTEQ